MNFGLKKVSAEKLPLLSIFFVSQDKIFTQPKHTFEPKDGHSAWLHSSSSSMI